MKKIIVIIFMAFLNSFVTSCTMSDDELITGELENVQSTGGDDNEGEILPPPPPPPKGN